MRSLGAELGCSDCEPCFAERRWPCNLDSHNPVSVCDWESRRRSVAPDSWRLGIPCNNCFARIGKGFHYLPERNDNSPQRYILFRIATARGRYPAIRWGKISIRVGPITAETARILGKVGCLILRPLAIDRSMDCYRLARLKSAGSQFLGTNQSPWRKPIPIQGLRSE